MIAPKWTYKLVTVDNLETIQQELTPLIKKHFPECYNNSQVTPESDNYVPLNKQDVIDCSPTYVEMIRSMGLLDRWELSLFSATSKKVGTPSIHIDHYDPKQRCYGLNLPLINCENTYTIWYDATILEQVTDTNQQDLSCARFIDYNKPYTEIDRLDVSKPAWVNTFIPHSAYSENENTRVLISARFSPEVHELF